MWIIQNYADEIMSCFPNIFTAMPLLIDVFQYDCSIQLSTYLWNPLEQASTALLTYIDTNYSAFLSWGHKDGHCVVLRLPRSHQALPSAIPLPLGAAVALAAAPKVKKLAGLLLLSPPGWVALGNFMVKKTMGRRYWSIRNIPMRSSKVWVYSIWGSDESVW